MECAFEWGREGRRQHELRMTFTDLQAGPSSKAVWTADAPWANDWIEERSFLGRGRPGRPSNADLAALVQIGGTPVRIVAPAAEPEPDPQPSLPLPAPRPAVPVPATVPAVDDDGEYLTEDEARALAWEDDE